MNRKKWQVCEYRGSGAQDNQHRSFSLTNDFCGAMMIPEFRKKGVNLMLYIAYVNRVKFAPFVFVR